MTPSPLVLGAMMFGTTIDEATSFRLLDRFVDAGGEWIDTADCYSFWASDSGFGHQSEELLGRWLAGRPGVRDRVKLSTKLGAEPREAGNWPASREGLAPATIRAAIEGSLRRLGTDRVDLLWAHMEDRSVPIEETADAMSRLVTDGATASIGASNHPAWRVERARAHVLAQGGHPFSAMQLSHSYLATRPGTQPPGQSHRFGVLSDEQLDYATDSGVELWAYSPLLGGAYDNPAKPIPGPYEHLGTAQRLAALDSVAQELAVPRGQVVLAWLLASGIRPILGGSRLDQLESALAATALELPAELRDRLDGAGRS